MTLLAQNGISDEEKKQRNLTQSPRARERALELVRIYRDHIKTMIPLA